MIWFLGFIVLISLINSSPDPSSNLISIIAKSKFLFLILSAADFELEKDSTMKPFFSIDLVSLSLKGKSLSTINKIFIHIFQLTRLILISILAPLSLLFLKDIDPPIFSIKFFAIKIPKPIPTLFSEI